MLSSGPALGCSLWFSVSYFQGSPDERLTVATVVGTCVGWLPTQPRMPLKSGAWGYASYSSILGFSLGRNLQDLSEFLPRDFRGLPLSIDCGGDVDVAPLTGSLASMPESREGCRWVVGEYRP